MLQGVLQVRGGSLGVQVRPYRQPGPGRRPRLAHGLIDCPPMARPIRVLIAKPGLDGHDRGAKVIARALRDAGMEVIYSGLRQTPEQIATAAIQEDVDVVGLSILSGAHNVLFPEILGLLEGEGGRGHPRARRRHHPGQGHRAAEGLGIREIFLPGTPTQTLVDFIRNEAGERVGG